MAADPHWADSVRPDNTEAKRYPYAPPNYPVHGTPTPSQVPPQQTFTYTGPTLSNPSANPIGGGSSLVFGLLSWIPFVGLLGIAGILLALNALKRSAEQSKTLAPLPLAGLITSAMGLGATIFIIVIALFVD